MTREMTTDNDVELVEGEATAVEDEATTLVDTCKGEDMVEVLIIFQGLREDKMGNVPRGGCWMV
jgi:hypothetical protein